MGGFWRIDPQTVPLNLAELFCAAEVEGDPERIRLLQSLMAQQAYNRVINNAVAKVAALEEPEPGPTPAEAPVPAAILPTEAAQPSVPTKAVPPTPPAAPADRPAVERVMKFLELMRERFNGDPFEIQLSTLAKKCELDVPTTRTALATLDREDKVSVKEPLQRGWSHRFSFPGRRS